MGIVAHPNSERKGRGRKVHTRTPLGQRALLNGGKVLLIDRDQVGFSSYLCGIEEKGLVASIVDGETHNYMTTLTMGQGSLTVLKFYGDGPRFKADLQQILSNRDIESTVKRLYSDIITRGKFDYVVLDNAALTFPTDEGVRLEMETYLQHFPSEPSLRLFVSDPSTQGINSTLNYIEFVNSYGITSGVHANVSGQVLAINMVPPGSNLELLLNALRDAMKRVKISLGVVIPFMDNLFQYSNDLEEMPLPPQIRDLARAISKGYQLGEIIK